MVRFLVSSKALSLGSPVFAGLFKPHFEEGKKTEQGELPEIPLGDDDAYSTEILLRVLHHQNGEQSHNLSAKTLAALAVLCDKYDCFDALQAWIAYWFSSLQALRDPSVELGHLLLAASMFRSSKYFAEVSTRSLKELRPSDHLSWDHEQSLELLPTKLHGSSPYVSLKGQDILTSFRRLRHPEPRNNGSGP